MKGMSDPCTFTSGHTVAVHRFAVCARPGPDVLVKQLSLKLYVGQIWPVEPSGEENKLKYGPELEQLWPGVGCCRGKDSLLCGGFLFINNSPVQSPELLSHTHTHTESVYTFAGDKPSAVLWLCSDSGEPAMNL